MAAPEDMRPQALAAAIAVPVPGNQTGAMPGGWREASVHVLRMPVRPAAK
jgi:hypothetical protein